MIISVNGGIRSKFQPMEINATFTERTRKNPRLYIKNTFLIAFIHLVSSLAKEDFKR